MLSRAVIAIGLAAKLGSAQLTSLIDMTYAYTALPTQAEPDTIQDGAARAQTGYNNCTAASGSSQSSMCQTMVFNSISDFCLFAPPSPNSTIADTEGIEVAWCTQNHGGRIMPNGTLTGIHFVTTEAYIQITGTFNQSLVDMYANDSGGELDPRGADGLGNPVGALVYSNNTNVGATNGSYIQIYNWNLFLGENTFCFRACNPTVSQDQGAAQCLNTYDIVGCKYNMPGNYSEGSFDVCSADVALPVGTYVSNGQTMTWPQQSENAGQPAPYTPSIPASSSCTTYQSSELYTVFGSVLSGSGASAPTAAPVASGSAGSALRKRQTQLASGSVGVSSGSSGSSSSAASAASSSSMASSAPAVASSTVSSAASVGPIASVSTPTSSSTPTASITLVPGNSGAKQSYSAMPQFVGLVLAAVMGGAIMV